MSTATLPLPVAPGIVGIFFTELRYEFVRALRTKAYSLSVIGFPVVFYIFFGLLLNRGHQMPNGLPVAKLLLAGYAVFATIGSSLFGIGVGLSGDLSAGWLELKRASPMPPTAYLLAKCGTAMGFAMIIASILTLLGITMGGVHISPVEYGKMLGLVVLGSIPFACMGLLLALVAPFNAAPGFANMLYLPMSILGGLWFPIDSFPKALISFAHLLPTYHLNQLMLGVFGFGSGSLASHWTPIGIFTVLMIMAAGYTFNKREQNN